MFEGALSATSDEETKLRGALGATTIRESRRHRDLQLSAPSHGHPNVSQDMMLSTVVAAGATRSIVRTVHSSEAED